MWKALLNKYFLGGLLIVVLLGFLAWQEMRYKDTLLTLQATENSLQTASQELVATQVRLEASSKEIDRINSLRVTAESITKDVAVQLKASRERERILKDSLSVLKKEYKDVEEYLNTNVPDVLADRLRKRPASKD